MGYAQASEMADAIAQGEVDERQAIVWHLRTNCFPPLPLAFTDVALAALRALERDLEADDDIVLPEGVTWRGETAMSPWEVIEAMHLNAFVNFYD